MYCIAHAPPPSMYLTDVDKDELTKHIYGIVNGDDAIPRFFGETIINIYNIYSAIKDSIFSICSLFFSDEDCTINSNQVLGIIFDMIAPILSKRSNSFAQEGLKKNVM